MSPTMASQWSDQHLQRDLHAVAAPDTLKPFTSTQDAFDRLVPYHVFNSSAISQSAEGRYSAEHVLKAAEPAERARKRHKVIYLVICGSVLWQVAKFDEPNVHRLLTFEIGAGETGTSTVPTEHQEGQNVV